MHRELKSAGHDASIAAGTMIYTGIAGGKVILSSLFRAATVIAAEGLKKLDEGANSLATTLKTSGEFNRDKFAKKIEPILQKEFDSLILELNREQPPELLDRATDMLQTQKASDIVNAVKLAGVKLVCEKIDAKFEEFFDGIDDKDMPSATEIADSIIEKITDSFLKVN